MKRKNPSKELQANVAGEEAEEASRNPFAKSLKKQKVTGKGVHIFDRIAHLLAENDSSIDRHGREAFLQVRLVGGRPKNKPKGQ